MSKNLGKLLGPELVNGKDGKGHRLGTTQGELLPPLMVVAYLVTRESL